MACFAFAPFARRSGGRAEGGNPGDIFGTAAQPTLLTAAADKRFWKMNVLARANERANTLGAADLVRREGQEIGTQRGEIACAAAHSLDCIDMQKTAYAVHDCRSLGDRLNDTGLVIGEHQGNERSRRFRDGRSQRRQIETAIGTDRQFLNRIAGKAPSGAYRGMLDCRKHEPRAEAFLVCGFDRRRQRQHIGFGSARGEKYVTGKRSRRSRGSLTVFQPSSCTFPYISPTETDQSHLKAKAPKSACKTCT